MYWLIVRVLRPIVWVLFRPTVRGTDHLPETGGVILASNHLSFADHGLLMMALDRQVSFLAKAEYFTGRGIRGRLVAWLFRSIGQLPVDRSGGKASMQAVLSGLQVVRSGRVLGIYPEGTRSVDGRLYKGRTGVARIAVQSGAPVIPVAMLGTDKVQPIGQRLPRLGKVGVLLGEPMDFSHLADQAHDRKILRDVTDTIMQAICELSGQDYVDEYATRNGKPSPGRH